MPAYTYIKDDMVYLLYDIKDYGFYPGAGYKLGTQLIDFLWINIPPIMKVYDELIEATLVLKKNISVDDYKDYTDKIIKSMDEYSVYLHFYIENFLKITFNTIRNAKIDFSLFQKAFPNMKIQANGNIEDMKYMGEFRAYLNAVKETIFINLLSRSHRLQEEIDFITNIMKDEKNASLTPMQRLYLLDLRRAEKEDNNEPYYTNNPFKTQFVPLINGLPIKGNITTDNISEKNIEVVEMYEINDIDDLIRFELLKTISNNVLIKKCANCGYYFVPDGRVDTIYCNRAYYYSKDHKTCAEIGSIKKYKDKIKDDPIYIAYNKAYKRYNSRVRHKKMSQADFLEWSEEARRLRDDCYNDKISLSDYKIWLDK